MNDANYFYKLQLMFLNINLNQNSASRTFSGRQKNEKTNKKKNNKMRASIVIYFYSQI